MTAAGASVSPVRTSKPSMEVFPNPANALVTVSLPDGMREGQFVLYSTSGQRILSTPIASAGKVDIAVGSVPSGAYLLRFESNGSTSVGSVINILH